MSFFALSAITFSVATALIALYAEVSKLTPYSSKHSLIRSIICVACIVFAGIAIGPAYVPSVLHTMATFAIFSVSCLQFYLELSGKTVNDLMIELEHDVGIDVQKH